jgi:hypothetical protein
MSTFLAHLRRRFAPSLLLSQAEGRVKLGINGFGRIGRLVFRAAHVNPHVEVRQGEVRRLPFGEGSGQLPRGSAARARCPRPFSPAPDPMSVVG